jgi:hypothetical protein
MRWLTAFGALIYACVSPSILLAQTEDPHDVQPERPTVATHAGTVAPGWVEIEVGGEYDRAYDQVEDAFLTPIVVKLGVTRRTQLNVYGSAVRPPGSGTFGVGDISAGLKWRIADNLPILGRVAVLPILKLPTGSTGSGDGTGTVDETLLLISSHDIGPVELDVNVGFTHRSGNGDVAPRTATLWTISFGGPGVGDVGWVAEVYGYPRTAGRAGQDSVVSVLCGPTVSARQWLSFDAGVIVPITGPAAHALYFGGVWNIGRLWR